MHERQAIRDFVVAALTAGPTSAGANVFKTRIGPLKTSELPAICVYTQDEEVEDGSSAPREMKRTVQVSVDGWVKLPANGAVDDALDDLALEIETALDQDIWMAGAAGDSRLASTAIGVELGGERPMGCVHLVYEVDYHTTPRISPPGDTFDTAGVTITSVGAPPVPADDFHGAIPGNQPQDLVDNIHTED